MCGSVALREHDGAAHVIKMNYYISWQEESGGEMELSRKTLPPSLLSARQFRERNWVAVCV